MHNPYLNQVKTFQDAENIAKSIGKKYAAYQEHHSYKQFAIHNILVDIYLYTNAMQREGKIEKIHNSCVQRMPHTSLQTRSNFAVIMLLLSVSNPELFSRYKRYRVSKALALAHSKGVKPENLLDWLGESGGLEGIKRSEGAIS